MKNLAEMALIEEALSEKDIKFLEGAKPFVRVPGGLVVHAGIPGNLSTLPTDENLASLSKSERRRLELLSYTWHLRGKREIRITIEVRGEEEVDETDPEQLGRFISSAPVGDLSVIRKEVREKGEFIPLGKEGPDDPFWAEVYDGRFGHVYFGHQPWVDEVMPKRFPHATGLDLGAVFGNRLAAVVLEAGKADQAIVVQSTGKFSDVLW